ncbi:hypothetical protein PHYSODRAFT_327088 [Phytophthora sojae]|uniref:Uncharacterized protein n=1 Tax=Phytophthora sojae (strain P6497) TaxID=1094619 RepID=G4YXD7_PHYSP|nr:hypothetical protein PHYSODRAFT_327088 [Phytophthora sojae]EGZ26171.1 hypothetical protein PHYSODRAFT_327088 [Phytophthora sojae]|eukprot:XP_009521459.1 hypothetical protein PHYSODRAFT_327088 [Phytophthora sojae]
MPSPRFAPHGRPQHSMFTTILVSVQPKGNPQPNVPTARSERISRGRNNSQSRPHFSFCREENKTPKKPQPPPSAMAKSRDVNREAVLRRLRARLDRRSRGADADADADAQLRAQVDFYVRLRAALFVNSGSTNVDAVDAVAVAVLADDTLFPVELLETVTLLPLTDALRVVAAPAHDLFTVPGASARSTTKRPTTRSASKSPPAKNQRKSKDQDQDDEEDDNEDDGTEAYTFSLPDKYPAAIRRDINKIVKQADAQGKTPPRMAYPWVGQRAWYDPQEHPALHVAHWRFWMHWRDVFFACALYAPSDEWTARRKKKSKPARRDSSSASTGKAARRSTAAKANAKSSSDATVVTDLATLYRHERGRYDAIIARALDPFRVDEDGYQSISELLEQTKALDPTKPPHLRLSDEALARVVIDVTGGDPPNPSWKGKQPFPPQKAYDEDKEQRDNYSDFADDEDMFTVLPPTSHSDEEEDGEPEELSEKLPEAEVDQDQEDDEEGEQADQEDEEEHSSGVNESTDDDKKSSAGDEADNSAVKKKSTASSATPKSK